MAFSLSSIDTAVQANQVFHLLKQITILPMSKPRPSAGFSSFIQPDGSTGAGLLVLAFGGLISVDRTRRKPIGSPE